MCPTVLVMIWPLLPLMVRRMNVYISLIYFSLSCSLYPVGPIITVNPVSKNVTINIESINLTCAAVGVPIPSITWIHNGSAVDSDSDMDITVVTTPSMPGRVSSTITILTATPNNTGYYACNATSSVEAYDTVMSEVALVLVQGTSLRPLFYA